SDALGGSGARWLLAPPFIFVGLLLLVPLFYIAQLAFEQTLGEQSGISEIFGSSAFWDSLWRTFVLASLVSIFTLVLGTLYAIALAVAPRWLAIVMLIALFLIFWTSLLVRTYGWILLYLPEGPIYEVLHAVGLQQAPIEIFQTNFASYPAMV